MDYNRQHGSYKPSRRQLLGLIGAGFLIPIAGCIGDDNTGDPTPTPIPDGDLPLLGDILQWEANYQIWHAGEDHIITVHGDDFVRSTWDEDDIQTDQVRFGNEVYMIIDPRHEHDMYDCITWTDATVSPFIDWEQFRDQHGGVRAVEQTSLLAPFSNDPVYRFELDGEDLFMNEFFIEVDTGYPFGFRNVETEDALGFHSWGHNNAFPELPADCRSP